MGQDTHNRMGKDKTTEGDRIQRREWGRIKRMGKDTHTKEG